MRKLALALALLLGISAPTFGQILSLPANPRFENLFLQSGGYIDWGSPGTPGDNRLTHTLGAGLTLTGAAPTLNLGSGLVGDPSGILCTNSFSAAINRPICLDAANKKISLPSDLLIEGTSTSLRYWDGAAYRTGFLLQSGSGGINLPTQVSQEKVVNGDFTVCPGAWVLGADWSCGAGTADKAATGVTTLEQNISAAANEVYLVVYTATFTVTTGGVTVSVGGVAGTNRAATGTYREYIRATGAGNLIFTPGNALSVFTIDNVSVTQVGTQAADSVAMWVQDVNGVAGSAGVHIRDELGRLFRFGNGALYLGVSGDTASAISLTPSANALTLAGGSLVWPAGTVSAPSSRGIAGVGANVAGSDVVHGAGPSTGSAAGGEWSVAVSPAGGAGSTENALVKALRIDSDGKFIFRDNSGMVFGSLGTATRGIDLSATGLSGSADYWIYNSSTSFWRTDGAIRSDSVWTNTMDIAQIGGNFVLRFASDAVGGLDIAQSNTAFLIGKNLISVGSLTACTSNGTTTITKATHGLTLAAGELVHITGATTAADKGFYRIISSTADTIVVDRALAGSDADVALTVYKDVIGIFASDGTNGQRIMNYSAQNKPLQLGGDTLATTATLTSKDVFIGGLLGLSSEQAAGAQAGTIANAPTVGNPGKFFKVYDSAGAAWAIPAWAIP